MTKLIAIGCSVVFMAFATGAMARHFWKGPTMSPANVEKKWGAGEFDASKFRNGDTKTRSTMAKSLMQSKYFIGKSVQDVKIELGPWDGYYFSDMFPAYIIQDGRQTKDESWQLVFMLNNDEKVSEIIVHKNCCE